MDPKNQIRQQIQDSLTRLAKSLRDGGMPDDVVNTSVKDIGAKCGMDMAMPAEVYQPLGGAQTFEDAEAYQEGLEWQAFYSDLSWKFARIVDNILGDSDLDPNAIATAVETAAGDFEARAAAFRRHEAAESSDDEDEEAEDVAAVEAGLQLGSRAVTNTGYTENDEDANEEMHQDEEAAAQVTTGTNMTPKGSKMRTFLRWMGGRKTSAPKHSAKATPATRTLSGFRAFKTAAGDWRWIAVHSNNFRDREGEIFPERAHKAYVARVDKTKEFPYLWDWHVPLVMGRADVVDYDAASGMVVSAGYFYPGQEHAAKALSEMHDLGVSHGYEYPDDSLVEGSYDTYHTFEVSPLPANKAANEGTFFLAAEELKENMMAFNKEKRDYLIKVHGEPSVKAMEDLMVNQSKAMKAAGIDFKDFDEAVAPPPPPPETPNEGANTDAKGLDAVTLASVVLTAVKEANAPILARLEALEADDDAKLAAKYYRPRAADVMDRQNRPTEMDGNVVSGPRGGAKALGDAETTAAVREAQRQLNQKDTQEAADWVPPQLEYYAKIGLMGGKALAGSE